MNAEVTWKHVAPHLWSADDSCKLYALDSSEGWVVINAGTGAAIDTLRQVQHIPIHAVLLTHHFRDHSAAAPTWKAAGAAIYAPYWEQDYFINAKQHWIGRQTWNSYDNQWDRMSPLADIPIDAWLMDYSKVSIGNLDIEVVPTPGVSMGASSFVLTLEGHRYLAVGEIIHSPGKVYRVSPLQYDYGDNRGAHQLLKSIDRLTDVDVDLLLPSKGEPIPNARRALELLWKNIDSYIDLAGRPAWPFVSPRHLTLEEFAPNAFFVRGSGASTHFLRGVTGKIMTLDYGYECPIFPSKIQRTNRRPVLQCPKEQIRVFGTDRIDLAIPTHYHDDHLSGFPLLQRLYGTEVWAGENFADILERPDQYDLPCLWHEPIKVHRKVPLGEWVEWDGIQIRMHPVSGHTRYGVMTEIHHGGLKFVVSGDQLFFRGPTQSDIACYPNSTQSPNHVYRNGLDLGCYHQTLHQLEEIRPDWLLVGHAAPYRVIPELYRILKKGADFWEEQHRTIMPLSDADAHFGPESQIAKLYPYRAILEDASAIRYQAWVLNPYPHAAEGIARLVAPEGWSSSEVAFSLAPREKSFFSIALTPPDGVRCLRQPIGLEIWLNGKPFGQVTEALVSVGEERPWQSPSSHGPSQCPAPKLAK